MFRTPASISSGLDNGQNNRELVPVRVLNLELSKPTRPGVLVVSKMRNRTARSSASTTASGASTPGGSLTNLKNASYNVDGTENPAETKNGNASLCVSNPPETKTLRVCAQCNSVDCMEVASAHEIVCTKCGASVDASMMADVHMSYGIRSMVDNNQSSWVRNNGTNAAASQQNYATAIGIDGDSKLGVYLPQASTGYKRISHFMERLAQLQGRERITYPEDLMTALRTQITMLRLDAQQITPQIVRFLLKKLRKPQFFENCNSLANVLGGFELPVLSDELRDKLRVMFLMIQQPFDECSPPGRKNFLSYNFIVRKFLEILEQDHLLSFFPSLKSRDKNVEQELVWQHMCKKLNWPYYPTI